MTDMNSAEVEFIGGPSDGRTLIVPTAYMGKPPHTLRLPVEQPLSLQFLDQADAARLELNQALYESTGVISDDRHTWPYQYRGLR